MNAPGCDGPCDQGRKPCPTPEACEMGLPHDRTEWSVLWPELAYLGAVVGLVTAIAFVVTVLL